MIKKIVNQKNIENQIKAIPGNTTVLEKLYKLLDDEEAIAFIGAGASAEIWPLWNEFLKEFIEQGQSLGKITETEVDYLKTNVSQNPLEIAQQLRNKIGERDYFEYIQETFKDKISPQTDGAFTLAHKALLQLPIHNYITLNYDAGLTNARALLYPQATTSYFYWDQEEAKRIRNKGFKRLVLHAHGRHDRSDSIILTLNDYRKVYDNRSFVRLLNEIFNSENLIIIGFGMTDPYIKQLFNNINKDCNSTSFQHIAFIGLDNSEMSAANLHRERVEMVYGSRVLFYPTENHHKALTDWLQMLVENYSESACSRSAEEIKPYLVSPKIKAVIHDKYIHKPTNDDNFKGRKRDFAILNRWANDPDTKMIAITGIGGQGKTALVGQWLKQERTQNLAKIPLFYWSFYEDMDVRKFLQQVVEFCSPIALTHIKPKIEPISFILSTVQRARLLLVLDGLEVMQDDTINHNHGNITYPLLKSFLQNWVYMQHKGLMILTSRFHFTQFSRYNGVGFHQLDLKRLSKEDGVSLLKQLNILGDQNLLESCVEKLFGHPLALRVLASTVKRCCYGNINQFKDEEILIWDKDDGLVQKLKHLLSYYENLLHGGQKELLGIISLFKRPIETRSFVTLLGNMKSLKNTPLAMADKFAIERQLQLLIDDFLIEKTDEGITTHPVIRDFFREGYKINGTRSEIADFLKDRPGFKQPKNIQQVRDIVEAVQLLCDEGDFRAAHFLSQTKLSKGGYEYNIFRDLPAINEGLECDLAFVGDKYRQQKVANIFDEMLVAYYCSGVSLAHYFLGNLEVALEWRFKSIEINKKKKRPIDPIDLHEVSLIEITMGNLKKARKTISKAFYYSTKYNDLLKTEVIYNIKTYFEYLLGNCKQAYKNYEIAKLFEQQKDIPFIAKFSIMKIQQTEFFLRIKARQFFELVNKFNIESCLSFEKNDKLAYCWLLSSWHDIYQGKLLQAEKMILKAEHILRTSGMLERICRLDWVWALLAEAKEDYQKGLQHINSSLFICADRGFLLLQADHYVLRGRLYLIQFQKENQENLDLIEKACDDSESALKIAKDTGYIWAKVDALELLSSYHQIRATLLNFNTENENNTAMQYALEASSLKKNLRLTEKQMKKIKILANKEFEKQTTKID